MKLENKPTALIDGHQWVLTGNYEMVGHLTEDMYIIRCTDTNAIYIIQL